MILPALVLYLLVMAFPIVLSIVLSLSNWNGGQLFGGERWQITGFQQYARLGARPAVLAGAEEQHLHRDHLRVRPASAGVHLRLPSSTEDRAVRRFLAGRAVHAAIISVIVLGIMWGIIFSPTGLIADVMNKLYANGFTRELEKIFTGGITVDDGS